VGVLGNRVNSCGDPKLAHEVDTMSMSSVRGAWVSLFAIDVIAEPIWARSLARARGLAWDWDDR
jgi:hypothetical protein